MDIDVYNKYVGEWGIELWSPDAPNLYTLKISILDEDDNCKDEVESYFGMRDIRIRNGLVLLNGQPLYQRLVLDQGYWKDTGLTPENDDVLLKDIEYVKRSYFVSYDSPNSIFPICIWKSITGYAGFSISVFFSTAAQTGSNFSNSIQNHPF